MVVLTSTPNPFKNGSVPPRRCNANGDNQRLWYSTRMTTVEDIERAVEQLPPEKLAKFRAWFEQFEANRFDRKIEMDAHSGRLDRLADEALREFREGRAREL